MEGVQQHAPSQRSMYTRWFPPTAGATAGTRMPPTRTLLLGGECPPEPTGGKSVPLPNAREDWNKCADLAVCGMGMANSKSARGETQNQSQPSHACW